MAASTGRGGKSTWLLEAASDQPLRAITLNNAPITIEIFIERPDPLLKKLIPPSKHFKKHDEALPSGFLDEDTYHTDEDITAKVKASTAE